jgi:hypothetical protein
MRSSWCWTSVASYRDELWLIECYVFFEPLAESICFRSLQVEQKIWTLCFLYISNDLSMYWPQPRQRKIRLINSMLHFSLGARWSLLKKIGWAAKLWDVIFGIDPSEAVTNQKRKTQLPQLFQHWVSSFSADGHLIGQVLTVTGMNRLTNGIRQPSRWSSSEMFWTWREISSAMRCLRSPDEWSWAVVYRADGVISMDPFLSDGNSGLIVRWLSAVLTIKLAKLLIHKPCVPAGLRCTVNEFKW